MKKEEKKKEQIFWIASIVIVILLFILSISLDYIFDSPEQVEIPKSDFSQLHPDAVVNVKEFSDFTCIYSRGSSGTVKQLRDYYGDRINFTYKHFVTDGELDAVMAAQASECARDQNKFWEYHDALFANFGDYDIQSLKDYAEELNLNTEEFDRCISTGSKIDTIKEDIQKGDFKSVRGTPTFFVNGRPVEGSASFTTLKQMIDEELETWE